MSNLQFSGVQAIILPDTPPFRVNGIVIPDESRKPTNTGVIISIAEGDLKEGDKVAYNHRTGYEFEHNGVKYLSINQNYILLKDMQPLHARVLIEPIKQEQTTTEAGLVLLEDKTVAEGKVIATGNGTSTDPMLLEVGDTVIYPKNAGTLVKGLLVLNQADIMCFEERENECDD